MPKKPVTIKLTAEIIARLDRISWVSIPHISKTAAIEYCLERSLHELENGNEQK